MHAAVKNMNLNEVILPQLDDEKLEKIPILKKLRALEEQAGKDVTVGATSPDLEADQPKQQPKRRPRQNMQQDAEGERRRERRAEPEQKARHQTPRVRKESEGRREREGEAANVTKEKSTKIVKQEGDVPTESRSPPSVTTVYLGGIPAGLRVSELKTALRERKAAPLRLTWQGAQHRAFLDYSDPQAADQALEALQGLSLNGHNLQAEMAKSQRGGRRSGQPSKRQRPPIVSKSKIPPETKSGTEETE